ncbi:MAG: hypothetical protein ACRDTM_12810 [Micromonosporaceae bacterium]
MSHDVEELRAALTAHAAEPEFKTSFEGVRQRAARQRNRRASLVAGIAVLALFAIAVPVMLLKPWVGELAYPGGLTLPEPPAGWRVVDDPIRTGLPEFGGGEKVLWFTVSDQGSVALNHGFLLPGRRDVRPGTGAGGPSDSVLSELTKNSQVGSHVVSTSMSGLGGGYGLYFGDAARIEFVSALGLIREGERSVYPAQSHRLSLNPKVIVFWADLPSEDEIRDRENAVVHYDVKAYDAGGSLIKEVRPPRGAPPSIDPDKGFDPAKAPRIGELIRTGEDSARGGEVVIALHGKKDYVGAVQGLRDRATGKVRDRLAPEGPRKLPFDSGLSGWTSTLRMTGGRTLAWGLAVGPYAKITAKLGAQQVEVKTAAWSEDPDITVWWAVLPKGAADPTSVQVDLYDKHGNRLDGAPDGPGS